MALAPLPRVRRAKLRFVAPAPRPDPRGRRALLWRVAFATVAGLAPILLAWFERLWLGPADVVGVAQRIAPIGLGECVGMILGAVLGFRSRLLLGWVLGPTLGFLVGWLDVRIGYLLGGIGWLSPTTAAMVPVWGMLFGFALAATSRHRRRALAILGAAIVADCVGRWSGSWLLGHAVNWGNHYILPGWVANGVCYLPACATLVLVAPKEWRGGLPPAKPENAERPFHIAWWLTPAAVAGLCLVWVDARMEGWVEREVELETAKGSYLDAWNKEWKGTPEGIGLPHGALCELSTHSMIARAIDTFARSGFSLEHVDHALVIGLSPQGYDVEMRGETWLDQQRGVGVAYGCLVGLPLQTIREAAKGPIQIQLSPSSPPCRNVLFLSILFAPKESMPLWHLNQRAEESARIADRSRRLATRCAFFRLCDHARQRWFKEMVDAYLATLPAK